MRRIYGNHAVMQWAELQPWTADFFQQLRDRMEPQHAPKRLKQWLGMLRSAYPEAEILYQQLRTERDAVAVAEILARRG